MNHSASSCCNRNMPQKNYFLKRLANMKYSQVMSVRRLVHHQFSIKPDPGKNISDGVFHFLNQILMEAYIFELQGKVLVFILWQESRSSELPDISCLLVVVGFCLFALYYCFQCFPRQWNTSYYLSNSVRKD